MPTMVGPDYEFESVNGWGFNRMGPARSRSSAGLNIIVRYSNHIQHRERWRFEDISVAVAISSADSFCGYCGGSQLKHLFKIIGWISGWSGGVCGEFYFIPFSK